MVDERKNNGESVERWGDSSAVKGEEWRKLLAALTSSRKISYVFCAPARWLSRWYFPAQVCPSHGWVTWIMLRSSHQNIWTHSNGVYTLVFLRYCGSASVRLLISDYFYQTILSHFNLPCPWALPIRSEAKAWVPPVIQCLTCPPPFILEGTLLAFGHTYVSFKD